jgi:hypothetical protein
MNGEHTRTIKRTYVRHDAHIRNDVHWKQGPAVLDTCTQVQNLW